MEHTEIVSASELDTYARTRASEEVIPELIYLLVTNSAPDLTECRIPYGDLVNTPGLDGLVSTEIGYKQFVPSDRSFWEIGTGDTPQAKATEDFKKRNLQHDAVEKAVTTYVFATPRSSWTQTKQDAWLKARASEGWKAIRVLDVHQIANWMRGFPAIAKWMLKKIGLTRTSLGFETPLEHWELLKNLSPLTDPRVPTELFLTGRDAAVDALSKLFRGEIGELVVAVEGDDDLEDFVAAYLASLDEKSRVRLANKCLFVGEEDAWMTFTSLKDQHVLVASPKIRVDANQRLHLAARSNGHKLIIPVYQGFSQGARSIPTLRSPTERQIDASLVAGGFSRPRSSELAAIGANNLEALKRHMRGMGEVAPYASWETAPSFARLMLMGSWDATNPNDRAAIGEFLGKDYGEWIATIRSDSARADAPLRIRNESWQVASPLDAWTALASFLTEDDLKRFQDTAVKVLSQADPALNVDKAERLFSAGGEGRFSRKLVEGVANTVALVGARGSALVNCQPGLGEFTAHRIVKKLLEGADWKRWASLNSIMPQLAEAAPEAFLEGVETSLSLADLSPFHQIFQEEGSGFGGRNYLTGVLWGLETLAWSESFLVRSAVVLAELAAIDPGGNWGNRPINSLTDILLPWFPQTAANSELRNVAVKNVLKEVPDVGWKLLLRLLPAAHSTTTGTRKPVWRTYVPDDWKDGTTVDSYIEETRNYAALAIQAGTSSPELLSELVDSLPELPDEAFEEVIRYISGHKLSETPEDKRLPLWEGITKLVSHHRRFPDAHWSMKGMRLAKLDHAADTIRPTSTPLIGRRLFAGHDSDIVGYDGDYEAQQRELGALRWSILNDIFASSGVEGLLEFAHFSAAAAKVGATVGSYAPPTVDSELLPRVLAEDAPEHVREFAGGMVGARSWQNKAAWAIRVSEGWSAAEKLRLYLLMPFEPATWDQLESGSPLERSYWKQTSAYSWGLKSDELLRAVEMLLRVDRAIAAIQPLAVISHSKTPLPCELAGRALLEALIEKPSDDRLPTNDIVAVIESMQTHCDLSSVVLQQVEWQYLALLNHINNRAPKALEQKLASDPAFFAELIAVAYRSDKSSEHQALGDQERARATNAYRLLHGSRRVPGQRPDGSLSSEAFLAWFEKMKEIVTETGHVEPAMSQLGELLAHAPPDADGLWIDGTLAEVLDAKDADRMRNGYSTGLFNKRGVHSYTAGDAEMGLSEKYGTYAKESMRRGLSRLSNTMRLLADQYRRDAESQARRSPFE